MQSVAAGLRCKSVRYGLARTQRKVGPDRTLRVFVARACRRLDTIGSCGGDLERACHRGDLLFSLAPIGGCFLVLFGVLTVLALSAGDRAATLLLPGTVVLGAAVCVLLDAVVDPG
ncbi:hypothetical protein ABH930_002504 [Kitasatospora sp. GAS204A]|nr:hypothetical protein [Kitasatospora sp. GAS204B]